MTIKQKIVLLFILFLATLLRVYGLDHTPPHLSNDEISIAYDAYSVSKTLRDEHNHFLPISFQSHNTYKAPLAIYLAVPTVKVFGNNEYGVRLPSAILGILTVLLIGLLVLELTGNGSLALLTSFILSITPWHVYCSRMALESNIALFFVVLGIYCFFRGLNKNNGILTIISFVSFALSIYGYHTEWGFTPLIIFFLFLLNFKICIKKPVYLISLVLFLVLVAPIAVDAWSNSHTYARVSTETLLKDRSLRVALESQKFNIFQKFLLITNAELGNYSRYTNLGYLFFDGLNLLPKSDPFQAGLFLSIFLPCFLIGLFKIRKIFSSQAIFIYVWLLIAPLIPAFTTGGPNFIRNLVTVIPYSLAIAVGGYELWNYLKKKIIFAFIIPMLVIISVLNFFSIYYRNFPFYAAEGFQYGYKQIALYVKQHYDNYRKIVIDPKFGSGYNYDGVPHLYIPYYTYLDPQKFLDERKDLPTGLYFDKYEIRNIVWSNEVITPSTLYVVPNSNTPGLEVVDKLQMVLEIKLHDYNPAFRLYCSL